MADGGHHSTSPLVTIGVPVRNGGKYLRRALGSLVAQDYPNLEILISNNGSTDDTSAIADEFAASAPNVRVVHQRENIGAYGNFGFLLDQARGDYFAWAASDDFWEPTFVSAVVAEMERHPEAGVGMCAIERVREEGGRFDLVRFQGAADPIRMSHLGVAMAIAAGVPYYLFIYGLYRTSYLRRAFAHFWRVWSGDRLFLAQVALSTKIAYVDEVLHRRQVAAKLLNLRYEDEREDTFGHSPLSAWHPMIYAAPYLLSSPVIPWWRKLFVPMIAARWAATPYLWMGLYSVAYVASRRLLGARRQQSLRRALRKLLRLDTA